MTKLLPKELDRAEELMYEAKFEEALEIITNFEKNEINAFKDKLTLLVLKGRIYCYKFLYKEAVEVGELAYQLSQKQGLVSESLYPLILKAQILWFGQIDKGLELALKTEKLLNSLPDKSSSDLSRQRAEILHIKSFYYWFKGDYNIALELALQCLELHERLGKKLDIAFIFILIGFIYRQKGELNVALDYAEKSLIINKELNNQACIPRSLNLIGVIYYYKGNLDQAYKFSKESLMINKIDNRTKVDTFWYLGIIFREKGELERALKNFSQGVELAEKVNCNDTILLLKMSMGSIYRIKGDYDQAIEYLKNSLALSVKMGYSSVIILSLLLLIYINLDSNYREQAQKYLTRLKELTDKKESKIFIQAYMMAKALMLKTSNRRRNRVEAETLLKEISEDEILQPQLHILSLISLCDLLLEEITMYNNPEIIKEINPLITRLLDIAENQHSYLYLAETKLLQAKLALIEINIEEAKLLMTQAQRIAELHGLDLLAIKISGEHDTLLEQLDIWDNLKENNAPIAERVKLASTNGVLERIQGKRAVEPPETVDEQSTVLLILAEGGVLVFSYPFSNEWRVDEDLFSSFLSAFTSFSTEFFSKGLDRVKFGDEMMLMESIGSFSFCYLFKGQTYLARQKLIKFTEEVQNNTSLWQSLEHHHKTSQILELKENPHLESLITEIFTINN